MSLHRYISSGYGFINFDSDQTAIIAMHRMGGKVIQQAPGQPGPDGEILFADHSKLQSTSKIQAQPQLHPAGPRRDWHFHLGGWSNPWGGRLRPLQILHHQIRNSPVCKGGAKIPPPWLNPNQTDFVAGRLGRVRLQQGLRVREVRLRGRAAARPGLDDRGDGPGQQADQGLDGQPEEPGGERRRPVPSPRGYLQLGRSLCLAGPAEHCHQWLAGTCWQPSGSSSTSARRGLLAGHGWSLLPWQRGLGSPGSSNLARAWLLCLPPILPTVRCVSSSTASPAQPSSLPSPALTPPWRGPGTGNISVCTFRQQQQQYAAAWSAWQAAQQQLNRLVTTDWLTPSYHLTTLSYCSQP